MNQLEQICRQCKERKPTEDFCTKKGKPIKFCLECNRKNTAKWRVKHPDRYKDSLLKHFFGITLETYGVMMTAQASGCAICGDTWEPGKKMLGVDHDHETGDIRSLLCQKCNSGLGFFNDDLGTLVKAAEYLVRHGKKAK